MKGLALQIYFFIYLWNYHKQVGLTTSPINMLYAASLWKTMLSRMAIVDSCSVPMSNNWRHFFLERRTKVKDSIFWFKLRSNTGFFGMYGRVTVNKVIDGQKLRSMVNELTVTFDHNYFLVSFGVECCARDDTASWPVHLVNKPRFKVQTLFYQSQSLLRFAHRDGSPV